jgi:hypothetical protein
MASWLNQSTSSIERSMAPRTWRSASRRAPDAYGGSVTTSSYRTSTSASMTSRQSAWYSVTPSRS